MTEQKASESSVPTSKKRLGLCLLALHLISSPQIVQGFTPATGLSTQRDIVIRSAGDNVDDEISKQLARAKELLAKSKAKIEEKELEDINEEKEEKSEPVPFFAAKSVSADQDSRKKKFTKDKNEETGLATFDGDKMVELSESEEWEVRPLNQVFENEIEDKGDDPFADRDVAASIFNLRKKMQTDDYMKIFDKRNRFIGEQ
mmetsp:Transcript_34584/g.83871  ORF Transcript_34584/g.83871 Transcript_34584/m.83871 type:complete len:202 (-) Transcript_34584:574-1179(-)|eukprot:CAMPEP_0113631998 /NCGR_PEP_ID=MMETSP0017_2-20120614/16630_1 /TAXON_ID=2856 /ORGANISM="Cylindrotheca closterium" /LENGTH=201 /DNA_ID=CAMNT_0000542533 /DNA_START=114 /DNA_END=719 /DNA_ORIENTATION=+ /assembly_acc=CAM_ASM_000147